MTETQTAVVFDKSETLGYNPAAGKWAIVCKKHDVVLQVASRDRAREAAKNSLEWCEDCREQPVEEFPEFTEPHEQESDIVTFSAAQTDPVTDDQFSSMDEMLKEAHAAWLSDEKAKQVPEPVSYVGTYLVKDVPHRAVTVLGQYIRTVCNPDEAVMAGPEADENDPNLCTYCMAGLIAPSKEEVEKKRRGRPPKVKAEPDPEPEPMYPVLTDALLSATTELMAAITEHQSVADVLKALEILTPAVDTLRKQAPRRRVGVTTGARSGLVKQSKTVNPSEEVKAVQVYADAGDKRAQDIIKHVEAYVAGEDCSYCLEKGRSTRHGYASAFMSIGRELLAMENRTGIPLPEDIKTKVTKTR